MAQANLICALAAAQSTATADLGALRNPRPPPKSLKRIQLTNSRTDSPAGGLKPFRLMDCTGLVHPFPHRSGHVLLSSSFPRPFHNNKQQRNRNEYFTFARKQRIEWPKKGGVAKPQSACQGMYGGNRVDFSLVPFPFKSNVIFTI